MDLIEESYHVTDILKKDYGELYLKHEWKNRKSFNPLLRAMNKEILKSKRKILQFVKFIFFPKANTETDCFFIYKQKILDVEPGYVVHVQMKKNCKVGVNGIDNSRIVVI